jgi:hypothetical protein
MDPSSQLWKYEKSLVKNMLWKESALMDLVDKCFAYTRLLKMPLFHMLWCCVSCVLRNSEQ